MDEHGLPIVGTGVDYTKVNALEHKNTLVFLNTFVIHTAQFLNRFSLVCEERLSELSMRIQRLNISLNILEAKLSSIPSLESVQATTHYEPPVAVATAGTVVGGGEGSGGTVAATASAPKAAPGGGGGPPPPTQDSGPIPPPQEAAPVDSGRKKAKDDPRYQRFFKMKRLGVNPLQIAMEMKRHGLNPDVLDNEDAELPDEGGAAPVASAAGRGGDSSESSSESSDESDSSFGSN